MISQVIRIGAFQPLDMILKLANEEQKKHILENARGLDYQMYSSAFPGWVKIQGLYTRILNWQSLDEVPTICCGCSSGVTARKH